MAVVSYLSVVRLFEPGPLGWYAAWHLRGTPRTIHVVSPWRRVLRISTWHPRRCRDFPRRLSVPADDACSARLRGDAERPSLFLRISASFGHASDVVLKARKSYVLQNQRPTGFDSARSPRALQVHAAPSYRTASSPRPGTCEMIFDLFKTACRCARPK